MALISVYSRSPISHKFTIIEGGFEQDYVIQGTNMMGIVTLDTSVPKITEMEEAIFEKIKDKYLKMGHMKLFGGKSPEGLVYEPQIYIAKSKEDAKKIMNNSVPIVPESAVMTKSKDVTPLKETPFVTK